MKSKPSRYEASVRFVAWFILVATVTTVLWARIRLAGLPLERDEGEYAYTGQLLLHAIPPYKLAYSMKFPGTAAFYAIVMSILGESITAIRIGLALANLATIMLMFLLGRQLLGELAGITTAASYSVLSLMPHVLGTAAHATHFVVLFAVAGTLVLLRFLDRQAPLSIFASGCLFGLAVLMKQPGLLFVLFGSCYLLGHDWRARLQWKRICSRNLVFIFGASVPCVLTCMVLWGSGVFGKFWFWTIEYATNYGSQVSIGEGVQILANHFSSVLGTAWPIWALAGIGLLACATRPPLRTGLLSTFAGFSALAICPGFYFRPHYFILFLPAVALLSGAAIVAACKAFRTGGSSFAMLLLFTACLAWPLWWERDFFFQLPLPVANRMINGTNPFPESIKIAEFVRNRSSPSDTIAVLGSEPQIYFYAQRHSATGYIYTYSLMEPQPYARQMQQEMMDEIEATRPKFLILIAVGKSWLAGRDSDQTILRWMSNYCDANYDEVGLVNISEAGSEYYLFDRPQNVAPTVEHILVFRRKT